MLTDKLVHVEPTLPTMGAAGSIITDPTFNTQILRLTDSGDSTTQCITGYSNQSPTNFNSTKIRAICTVGYQRCKVWDFTASTMATSNGRIQANPPAGFQEYGLQWSRTVYNKYYGVGGKVLSEVTIPDGASTTFTNTTIRNFAAEVGAGAGDYITQMSMSDDNDVFAFHYNVSGVDVGYIAYKRSTNTVLLQVSTEGTINEVEIDKSGRYLVSLTNAGTCYVWDLQGTPARTTITTETFNHRAMGNGIVVSAATSNRLCSRNLATPNTVTYLLSSGWSYVGRQDHFSMSGSDNYMLGSRYFTTPGTLVSAAYDQECVEVSVSGDGSVRRHAHHRNKVWVSDSGPEATVSMDGAFVAFSSNWDGANSSARLDVYLAKLDVGPPDATPPSAPANLRVMQLF